MNVVIVDKVINCIAHILDPDTGDAYPKPIEEIIEISSGALWME